MHAPRERRARIGARLVFAGSALALACAHAPPPDGMAPEAAAYLDEAWEIIADDSYFADRVDWASIREAANARAKGARSPADTHEAIAWAVEQLGDSHARFWTPAQVQARAASKTAAKESWLGTATGRRIGDAAYLFVPILHGRSSVDASALASAVQAELGRLDETGAHGWIIDLRCNTGGNTWAGLAALGPLLGEGVLGGQHGTALKWRYRRGRARNGPFVGARVSQPYRVRNPEARVAVLTSAMTSSAAETLVIAFRGRAGTRVFGTPTAGMSSSRVVYPLSDGAELGLSVGVSEDRVGTVYTGPIEPDEHHRGPVAVAWDARTEEGGTTRVDVAETACTGLADDDPVLAASLSWVGG